MAFDMVGWDIASDSAALAKEPVSTTRAKMAQASKSGSGCMGEWKNQNELYSIHSIYLTEEVQYYFFSEIDMAGVVDSAYCTCSVTGASTCEVASP